MRITRRTAPAAQSSRKRALLRLGGMLSALVLVAAAAYWAAPRAMGRAAGGAAGRDLPAEGPIYVAEIPAGTILTREQFERVVFPIERDEEEWRELLGEGAYAVLRERKTERAFSGRYDRHYEDGIYYSAATGQPLFSSETKYDSRTGWPSYYEPIEPGAVLYVEDYSLILKQIEIVDSKSGSHLGHVFDDGPEPTGRRYCINSAALVFAPEGGKPPEIGAAAAR